MKFKQKGIEPVVPYEQEETVDTPIQLMNSIKDVKLRIKSDITQDFVLAKLSDSKKEAIVELTAIAYFVVRLFNYLKTRAKTWHYDYTKKAWFREYLSLDIIKKITKNSNNTFDSYMTRIYMHVVLSRNDPDNFIVKRLSQFKDEIDENEQKTVLKETNKSELAKQLEPRPQI